MAKAIDRDERPQWWPAVAALGLVLLAALSPDLLALERGGLAPLGVAALVAGFVAVPLAVAGWRRAGDPALDAVDHGARAVSELWGVLVVGAVVGPWAAQAGAAAILGAGLLWVLGHVLARRHGEGPAGNLALLALLLLLVGGAGGLQAPGWTLLEPHWETWRSWLPQAVALGLALPAAGLGYWETRRPPAPRTWRLPWATGALALLGALSVVLARASTLEASAGTSTALPGALHAAAAVALAAAGAATARGRPLGAHVLLGPTAIFWFAGPARDAVSLWWTTVFPLGPALVALALARRVTGAPRWAAVAAAGVALLAPLAGWPGMPADPGLVTALALVPVAAVWYAGTRAVLGRAS